MDALTIKEIEKEIKESGYIEAIDSVFDTGVKKDGLLEGDRLKFYALVREDMLDGRTSIFYGKKIMNYHLLQIMHTLAKSDKTILEDFKASEFKSKVEYDENDMWRLLNALTYNSYSTQDKEKKMMKSIETKSLIMLIKVEYLRPKKITKNEYEDVIAILFEESLLSRFEDRFQFRENKDGTPNAQDVKSYLNKLFVDNNITVKSKKK